MKINLDDINEKEIMPGLFVKFVHSDNMTLAYWRFEPGAKLPLHDHINEQVVNVIEGEIELTVGDQTHKLTPGKVMVLPPNIPHSGKALSAARVIDVFYPAREDYK